MSFSVLCPSCGFHFDDEGKPLVAPQVVRVEVVAPAVVSEDAGAQKVFSSACPTCQANGLEILFDDAEPFNEHMRAHDQVTFEEAESARIAEDIERRALIPGATLDAQIAEARATIAQADKKALLAELQFQIERSRALAPPAVEGAA